ncbi:MAG: bifunctional response regulator/alkaline phosphatase family protein [Chitinispirillales bacterium]|jgi:CheY-like chemotaxis protein|nr:bifunctional response regulator/alkaline phosphatase family protein [Chitinispirillales bacterium]
MQRKNILWIDDEIEFFRAHIMFLEARGYSVTPLYSGYDGLSALHKNHNLYDIVLLDEQMPGKDGLSVLNEIKEFLPDLPVVMVTKSEEEDVMERAIGKKIDGYLTKPVNPSQILTVCKKLLGSQEILSNQVKNAFVKNYSEIRAKLQSDVTYKEWVKIYQQIVKMELDTQEIEDETLRQKHYTQKIEANEKFADFLMQNYPGWLINPHVDGKPVIANELLEKHILPEIKKDEKFALVIFDSLQLCQFVVIQRFLRKIFRCSEICFYLSTVPTTLPHALSSLLTGLLPKDFASQRPDLWEALSSNSNVWEETARFGLKRLNCEKNVSFYNILKDNTSCEDIVSRMLKENNFSIIFADFLDLISLNKQNKIMRDMISSGKAFRDMTSMWFEKSDFYKLLKLMCENNITVALTSSAGNILCSSSADHYGKHSGYSNMRFRSGEFMFSDTRTGYYVANPAEYGLPSKNENTSFNVLRGNYCFTGHGSYYDNMKKQLYFFERGGVSLEESIVPFAIFRTKQNENAEIL